MLRHRTARWNLQSISIFPKTESYRSLRDVSPVVEALALTQFDDYVKRVRIFIHPRHRERASTASWGEWVLKSTGL